VGQLSIKSFFGGRAHYRVGRAYHAVDASSYLILNEGQTYAIEIQSREPVESFCLFFAPGFVEETRRSLSCKTLSLLDEPASETERLNNLRLATREELFRRVCRARDYAHAMCAALRQSIFLKRITRTTAFSRQHY
jgi:hypothetical protein